MDRIKFFNDRVDKVSPISSTGQSLKDETYAGSILPMEYFNFLKENGPFTIWDNNYQLVDPYDWQDVVGEIFGGNDPDFSVGDCCITGISAFGKLAGWSNRYGTFGVDMFEHRVQCGGVYPNPMPEALKNVVISQLGRLPEKPNPLDMSRNILPMDLEDFDHFDAFDQPMLARCNDRFGPLVFGQIYGFAPALSLVGVDHPKNSIESVSIVPAFEHAYMLCQLGPFALTRYDEGRWPIARVFEK